MKKRVFLFIVLCVSISSFAQTQRNYAQELIELLHQEKYSEAREFKLQYADQLPKNNRSLDLMYNMHMSLAFNKPDSAIVYFEEFLGNPDYVHKLGPFVASYYSRLSKLYEEKQQFEKAISSIEKSIDFLKENPFSMDPEFIQGEISGAQAKITELKGKAKLSQTQGNYTQKFIDLLHQEKYSEAREFKLQYADQLPQNDRALDLVYNIHMSFVSNKPDSAIIYLEEFLSNKDYIQIVGPFVAAYNTRLCKLYEDKQQFEKAIATVEWFIGYLKENPFSMGPEFIQGEISGAQAKIAELKEKAKAKLVPQRNYAQELVDLLHQEKYSEAREFKLQYADQLPQNDRALDLVYNIHMSFVSNKPDSAIIYLEEFLSNKDYIQIVGPFVAAYNTRLCKLYEDKQQFERAIATVEWFIGYLKENPFSLDPESIQGEISGAQAKIAELKEKAKLVPQRNYAQELVDLFGQEKYFEAREFKLQYADQLPPNNEALDLTYNLYMSLAFNKPDSAIVYFEKCLGNQDYVQQLLGPDVTSYYSRLSEIYEEKQQFEKAISTTGRVIDYLEKNPYSLDPEFIQEGIHEAQTKIASLKERAESEPLRIIRRDSDISEIELKDGALIRFDALYNGQKIETLFDTGATYFFLVDEDLAKDIGIKINPVQDIAQLMNDEPAKLLAGTIDSIELKGVKLYNIPVIVGEKFYSTLPDSLKHFVNEKQIIMGLSTMKMIGRFEFDWESNVLRIPPKQESAAISPSANLILLKNSPYLNMKINDMEFTGFFDTGFNESLSLTYSYLRDKRNYIEIESGTLQPYKYATIMGICNAEQEKVKNPDIYFDGKKINNSNFDVYVTDRNLTFKNVHDGDVGVGFIKNIGSKCILDFDAMTVKCGD